MHVALIIDEERLEQEQSMLNRLCIGLMAEGVHVTRIVPDCALPDVIGQGEQRIALAPRVEAPMKVLPWMRNARASRTAEALQRSVPDVFYGVGEHAWQLGLDLAEALERPLLLDVCSIRQVKIAPGPDRSTTIVGYITCTAALTQMMSSRVGQDLVSMVPIGVSVTAPARAVLKDPAQPAIAVLGHARDLRAYDALLNGLRTLVDQHPSIQIFLELHGQHEHEIWRRADRLGLLKQISAIGQASLYRSLMTRCDLLLMPENLGEVRSITLEAMALGIPVIAQQDPALDALIDNETSWLIMSNDSAEWVRVVGDVLNDAVSARKLGLRGREYVAAHHRSSEQVNRLLEVLERAPGGGAIRLQPQPT